MKYAIEITEKTLALITKLNDGVTPELEEVETYYIWDASDEGFNQILRHKAFHADYEIMSPIVIAIVE